MGREHWGEIVFSDIIVTLESGASRPKGGVKGITEGIPGIGTGRYFPKPSAANW